MQKQIKGFSLIEMLLVMVIVSGALFMAASYFRQRSLQMRIDRTSLQMQQILNAGLAYYVANNKWPVANNTSVDITATPTTNNLQANGYLPKGVTIANPFSGGHYSMYTDSTGKLFTVYTSITGGSAGFPAAAGNSIAGTLPLAATTATAGTPPPIGTTAICSTTTTTCYIVTSINIPGQNLNAAGAVNFAGVYRHGGCVPVPTCPTDPATGTALTAEIQVVPVSVSGLNDSGSNAVYPISSFTAYAKGPATQPTQPPNCINETTAPPCNTNIQGNAPASNAYWRVCLQVITEKGDVQGTNNSTSNPATDYGANVTLMAITRCSISNEPAGSKFTIYGN